jgi:phosphoribosylformylglycinamidine cyclo-ligase
VTRIKTSKTYSDVGVDVAIEAKAARILYEASKQTWINRRGKLGEVVVPFDDFAGLRYVRADKLPAGTVMYGGSDGIATKAEFAERAGRYDTLAFDLMAMVCDDAVIRGGVPVLVKSVLDVNTLGKDNSRLPFIEQLAEGYVAAAKAAEVAVINGELAQLNDRAGNLEKFSLDWSADVTWFANEKRLITGYDVKPGDYLVGLQEEGLRCNGISLVRTILTEHYGSAWDKEAFNGKSLIEAALQPSLIYSPAIVEMFGGYDLTQQPKASLHAVAHISGGGIPEKLGRVLKPTGYGALVDNPYVPGDLLLHSQEIGQISDREAYSTWNMGQGMIVVTPDYDEVIKVCKAHDMKAKVIGRVTKEPGIRIISKGYFSNREPEVLFN